MKRSGFKRKATVPLKRGVLRKVSPKKVKKVKAHDASWYQKKADRLMQDIQRARIPNCEVCGRKNEVGHHYITKSSSSYLRYEWKNLVPLCHACHFNHHIRCDPHVHNTINRKRGDAWVDSLETDRRKPVKTGIAYYQQILEALENERDTQA